MNSEPSCRPCCPSGVASLCAAAGQCQTIVDIKLEIHSSKRCYIFGFGSLINSKSRNETGTTGEARPVRVHRMRRGWIYDVDKEHHPSLLNSPFTAVGVEMDAEHADSTVNGIIFEVGASEIQKYDAREARYVRETIDHRDIDVLGEGTDSFLEPDALVFVFIVPKEIVLHDARSRMLKQSYIDKFISGCLEIGTAFAVECIKTTHGWNGAYQYDRALSKFSKKIESAVKQDIDVLLDQLVPPLRFT